MDFKDFNTQEIVRLKRFLYDQVSPIMFTEFNISENDVGFGVSTKYMEHSTTSQGGAKRSKIKRYRYIVMLFHSSKHDQKDIETVIKNTIITIVHEFRHIYQLEHDIFPLMEEFPDIPYYDREWEKDAIEFSNEFVKTNMKKIFGPIFREAVQIMEDIFNEKQK